MADPTHDKIGNRARIQSESRFEQEHWHFMKRREQYPALVRIEYAVSG